jgi:hypothetical protein
VKFFPLLCLAVFSAWSAGIVGADMAGKKIPNARLLLGAKLLLAALLVLCVNSWLGWRGASGGGLIWRFYLVWCAHLTWAAAAGVILWYSEIWPAGDAKFFILTAAWLPLIDPSIRNFPDYLFLTMLINIFAAAGLVAVGGYIASGLYRASPADFFLELSGSVKERFAGLAGGGGVWRAAAYAANIGFLFLLQQVLNAEGRHFLARFLGRTELLFFFLFFLWDKISVMFRSRRWLYLTTACYVVYFFAGYFLFYDRLSALLLASLFNLFRFTLLLFFGRLMLGFLMEKKDVVFAGPGEIEPGMVLSEKAARILKSNPVFEGAFDDCFKDGLSGEQAGLVREWLKKLPVRDPKIETVTGRPFAVWIFAGAVITLLSGGSVLRFMVK